MSIESAKELLEKIKQDASLAEKLEKASGEERKKIIEEAGFDVTQDEVQQAYGELSDDDLDKVAGGATSWSCWAHYK